MDIRIVVVDLHGVITAVVLIVDDLIRGKSEDKRILRADLLDDLHVGSVHGSQRQRTVEHELHVTGSRRLLAGGRNLL